MQPRTHQVTELHDPLITHRKQIRVAGESGVVWVDHFDITEVFEDGDWIIQSKKFKRMERVEVKVGDRFFGFPVVQIDPEWIEREKQILKWNK